MSKKIAFITEVNDLLNSSNYSWKSEDAEIYWRALCYDNEPENKKTFSEIGKQILQYMQICGQDILKARDIGIGMNVSSRQVSGGIRKLVTDGYVEKLGDEPVVYVLTNKGKEIKF